MTTHKSFAARADIETILARRNAQRADVPVLQPAEPFLDMAGDDLRRQIFLTQSDTSAALCLRPEFTIPVCLKHIAENNAATRYGYVGTVFRQNPNGPSEFLQAGIEDIGDEDATIADARSVADSLACLSALGAAKNNSLIIGDQAIFDAVLADLGLASGWRTRLSHAFGDENALMAALDRLGQPAEMPIVPDDIKEALQNGDVDDVSQIVEQHLADASLNNSGGRTAKEIAGRLRAQMNAANIVPDPSKLDVLRKFLSLRAPLDAATDALEVFEHENGLDLGQAVAAFAKRNAALVQAGVNLSAATYEASFGRSMEYYTGLVFEVRSANGSVFVGGGRYDRLLPLLGASEPMKGVGFSLWLDQIAEANA